MSEERNWLEYRKQAFDVLKKECAEDEQIVAFHSSDKPYTVYHFIAPKEDLSRVDLAGCIEDTLHRLLDADCDDEMIAYLMNAVQETECEQEEYPDEFISIDLGYVIPGQIMNVWVQEALQDDDL